MFPSMRYNMYIEFLYLEEYYYFLFALHTPTLPALSFTSSPPLEVKWHFHFQIASYSFVNRIELL